MTLAREVHIQAATPTDVSRIQGRLRDADAAEIEAGGLSPEKALWRSWRGSVFTRAAYVDGEIAALWGVGGCPLGGVGDLWLLTTPAVERVPLTLLRETRKGIAEMLTVFPALTGVVDARYRCAVRLLTVLGFTVDNPLPFGPKGALFRRYHIERPG